MLNRLIVLFGLAGARGCRMGEAIVVVEVDVRRGRCGRVGKSTLKRVRLGAQPLRSGTLYLFYHNTTLTFQSLALLIIISTASSCRVFYIYPIVEFRLSLRRIDVHNQTDSDELKYHNMPNLELFKHYTFYPLSVSYSISFLRLSRFYSTKLSASPCPQPIT